MNGWQSYGMFNSTPGVGLQILWRPNGSVSLLSNNYWGKDTLGNPDRARMHTDDSIQIKYYDRPARRFDKPRCRNWGLSARRERPVDSEGKGLGTQRWRG